MPNIAVIGLGRFGLALSKHLGTSGAHVIAIDRNRQNVESIKEDVQVAVKLDSTDEIALKSQGVDKVDACVIAIGENFEAALLTTVIVKKLGVPKIICRAQTEFHAEIFRQIGADEVIQPETQAGEQLAHNLANPHVEDLISLAEGYTVVELISPKIFHNQTVAELALRSKYNVNLVAIKKKTMVKENNETVEKQTIISVPSPDDMIHDGDIMVLVGSDDALSKLPKE
ncbi:KtrAB potassium uptake system, peripheral membrane component KtrA [hydrothermal vent metagenome]|uniref:KtrAB potassium uptake system, peripheral membrane component KtrA n=1 Tax=hydrothermal vent metagenome TaxID=652676 RepID=A0A3B1DII7_9ZZZZ